MRHFTSKSILAVALSAAVAAPSIAESVKTSGNVCWTGHLNTITTSKGNAASTFDISWVFTSDDNDPKKASTGQCVGVINVVNGKPEFPDNFCTHIAEDGSTFMSRGVNRTDGQSRTYYGGTGKYKGITGKSEGSPAVTLKAPKGQIAGCRKFKGEYTIPG